MSAAPYGLEALREYRRKKAAATEPSVATVGATLADIPPDAPMEQGLALGVWNGTSFVSWQKWLTSLPVEALRQAPQQAPAEPLSSAAPQPQTATGLRPVCGSLFDWEVSDGRAG
jgi:hypothetical protein